MKNLEAIFAAVFPEGIVNRRQIMGTDFFSITLRSEYAHGIRENDPMLTNFKLERSSDAVSLVLVHGGSLKVKPDANTPAHHVQDRVSLNFRKINAKNEDELEEKFSKWLKKAKAVVDANAERMFPLDG